MSTNPTATPDDSADGTRETPPGATADSAEGPADPAAELTGEHPTETTAEFHPAPFRLDFAAVSDIGSMRKDNQDSGYAGTWLLAVCDGVGGAARGDLASATAIDELRLLDTRPTGDPLVEVRAALSRAHERIGQLVDAEPALSGTSTTAVVALFDGEQLSFGHLGDSRAYLLRGGEIRQLTRDHTFVQSLIDEGRLTEEAARTHPNRNLILRALDGVHDADPDLFGLILAVGDRVLICSDGASGVLEDAELSALLANGRPGEAAHEIVNASLEAGSTDNITCVVADVVAATDRSEALPILVGAVAEDPREPGQLRSAAQWMAGQRGSTRRTSAPRADSGTPAVVTDRSPTPVAASPSDPEEARYAPRPPRRFLVLRRLLVTIMVLGVIWIAGAAAWSWSQRQFYVGESDGQVTIFRGVNADLPVLTLSRAYETTDVSIERLAAFDAQQVRSGIPADDLDQARRTVDDLAAQQLESTLPTPEPTPAPTESESPTSDPSGTP